MILSGKSINIIIKLLEYLIKFIKMMVIFRRILILRFMLLSRLKNVLVSITNIMLEIYNRIVIMDSVPRIIVLILSFNQHVPISRVLNRPPISCKQKLTYSSTKAITKDHITAIITIITKKHIAYPNMNHIAYPTSKKTKK